MKPCLHSAIVIINADMRGNLYSARLQGKPFMSFIVEHDVRHSTKAQKAGYSYIGNCIPNMEPAACPIFPSPWRRFLGLGLSQMGGCEHAVKAKGLGVGSIGFGV